MSKWLLRGIGALGLESLQLNLTLSLPVPKPPTANLSEDSEAIRALTLFKTKLRIAGQVSVYRLRNGWIARRQAPENGWARQAYWTIYESEAAFQRRQALGGGEGRLTRAIMNVLNQHESVSDTEPNSSDAT